MLMFEYLENYFKDNENCISLKDYINQLPTIYTMKNIEFKGLLNIDKTLFIYNYCYLSMSLSTRRELMKKVLDERKGDECCDFLMTIKDCKETMTMTVEDYFWYIYNYIKDNYKVATLSKDLQWYIGFVNDSWDDVYTTQELKCFLDNIFNAIDLVFTIQKYKGKLLFNDSIIEKKEFNKIYNKYKEIIINR